MREASLVPVSLSISYRVKVVVLNALENIFVNSSCKHGGDYINAVGALFQRLRSLSPPWAVSLPGQVAAVAALQEPEYYEARYAETAALRSELYDLIHLIPATIDVIPGKANWLLCQLPKDGPDAAAVVNRCSENGVFLRDASSVSAIFGGHCVRIAVKDASSNLRIVNALASATV
jgi:histidinol-phosphate/aromatic aminotransferase/cobyric acid decarboxylase-like protein